MLRGTTLPQKVAPRKAQQLPYSLHVPEAAEFNPKGVIQLPLVYHVLFLRGKHVPSEPSLHIYYVFKPKLHTRPRVHFKLGLFHKMQILYVTEIILK